MPVKPTLVLPEPFRISLDTFSPCLDTHLVHLLRWRNEYLSTLSINSMYFKGIATR